MKIVTDGKKYRLQYDNGAFYKQSDFGITGFPEFPNIWETRFRKRAIRKLRNLEPSLWIPIDHE